MQGAEAAGILTGIGREPRDLSTPPTPDSAET
jgi:hypothetical protein